MALTFPSVTYFNIRQSSVSAASKEGSAVGSIISVEVSGCGTKPRCNLIKNTNATMKISFKTNVDSPSLTAVVAGVILSIETPFALPNPDGCVDSGVVCPLKADETYDYTATMPIDKNYPRVTVVYTMETPGC
ncbi:hypothetical protein JTB14_026092 [Gonioctena quinquepunctata]|nr:hypothetical protein JTB14_026092 [Gonioctena quinquepunctata]